MEISSKEIEAQIFKQEGIKVSLRFRRCKFLLSYDEYIGVMRMNPQAVFNSFDDRFNYFLDFTLSPRVDRTSNLTHGLYVVTDENFDSGPFTLAFETNEVSELRAFYNEHKNQYREAYFSHWIGGIQYFVATKRHSERNRQK